MEEEGAGLECMAVLDEIVTKEGLAGFGLGLDFEDRVPSNPP